MKKHTASIAAAALMLAVATAGAGASAGTADASSLPPGATAGSSTISGMLGANATQGTVVKQGDRIRVQRLLWDFNCTLGYVDPHAGVGYTAGHCGLPGEPVLNANYQIIGYFEASNGLHEPEHPVGVRNGRRAVAHAAGVSGHACRCRADQIQPRGRSAWSAARWTRSAATPPTRSSTV